MQFFEYSIEVAQHTRLNSKSDFFLLAIAGDSRHGLYGNAHKRDLYERGHVAVCSRGQAIALTVFVFSAIFFTALAVAFIRPFSLQGLSGSSGGIKSYVDHCYGTSYVAQAAAKEAAEAEAGNAEAEEEGAATSSVWSYDGEPIASNGEPFPWDDVRLPKFIQPVRYDIELTPNLTTLGVKGTHALCILFDIDRNYSSFH